MPAPHHVTVKRPASCSQPVCPAPALEAALPPSLAPFHGEGDAETGPWALDVLGYGSVCSQILWVEKLGDAFMSAHTHVSAHTHIYLSSCICIYPHTVKPGLPTNISNFNSAL